jgi:peptidoglycan hydrolase-like protein with peptidoglycan-binding domain
LTPEAQAIYDNIEFIKGIIMAKPKTKAGLYNKLRPYTFNKPLVVAFALLAVVTGFAYVASSYAYAYYWPTYAYPCDFHTVKYGSTGNCVKLLQWVLDQDDSRGGALWPQECGGYPYYLTKDGIFGSKTNSDVRTFQKWHHLSIDGVVGPNTWGQLKYYKYQQYSYSCGGAKFNG